MEQLILRQAAIDALGEEPYGDSDYEMGCRNQWGYDVEAIKELPSAEPQIIACGEGELHDINAWDMISRQAVISLWDKYHYTIAVNAMEFDRELRDLPVAEPQERTGYWIYDGFDHAHGIEWCHCSKCGNQENVKSVYTQIDKYPYCAKCGARMEVDNETN